MNTLRKKGFLRSLAYVPFLLMLFIIQAAILPRAPIFGVKAQLLPLVVASAGVCAGVVTGGVVGLFAGMLMDISFNEPTIVYTLVFCFLGLFIGYLCDTLLMKRFPTYILMSILALAVSGVTELLKALIALGSGIAPMLWVALFEALFSFIFAIPVYLITRSIERIE